MVHFPETRWSEEICSTEGPSAFCLRRDVPVYFKVPTNRFLVYYVYHAPQTRKTLTFERIDNVPALSPRWGIHRRFLSGFEFEPIHFEGFHFEGFHKDLRYLRLDDSSLEDIHLSGSSLISAFSRDGYLIQRARRAKSEEDGTEVPATEKTRDAALKKVEFREAILIGRAKWEAAVSKAKQVMKFGRGALPSCAPRDFIESVSVRESDFYLRAVDVQSLKNERLQNLELVHYPFEHKETMPGIYWMFQAAYEHNHRLKGSEVGIKPWLEARAPDDTFSNKRILTAEKFVWLKLDRRKGGKPRGVFDLAALDDWTSREPYEFTFCSHGLSYILAIADWWAEVRRRKPLTPKSELARQLIKPGGFSPTEAGHLVFLIGGSNLTPDELASFEGFLKDLELSEAKQSKLSQL